MFKYLFILFLFFISLNIKAATVKAKGYITVTIVEAQEIINTTNIKQLKEVECSFVTETHINKNLVLVEIIF